MPYKDQLKETARNRRRWSYRDVEAQKAYRRELHARNPAIMAGSQARWKQNQPEEYFVCRRMVDSKARARKSGVLHPDMDFNREEALVRECYRLIKETGEQHHIDHIIPATFGGWHHHLNLQILPETVNFSKRANPLWKVDGYKCWMDVPEFLWPHSLRESYQILRNHYHGLT